MKKLLLAASLSSLMVGSVFATEATAPATQKVIVGTKSVTVDATMTARTCRIVGDAVTAVAFPQIWEGEQFTQQQFKIVLEGCPTFNGKSLDVTFATTGELTETKLLANRTKNHPAENLFFKVTDKNQRNVFEQGYVDTVSLTATDSYLPSNRQELVYNVDVVNEGGEARPGHLSASFTYTVAYE